MGVLYKECPFCGMENTTLNMDYTNSIVFVECYNCGRVKYSETIAKTVKENKNEIATYLFYHRNKYEDYRSYYSIGLLDKKIDEYEWTHTLTENEILSFYNCSFSEKIDHILLHIATKSSYIGEKVTYFFEEYLSLLFIKRFNKNGERLKKQEIKAQESFIIDFLVNKQYVKPVVYEDNQVHLSLLVAGWTRVDELQKHNPKSKSVFIAMSFSKEMYSVREAIKSAVIKCGYTPRIMDEIDHNHQIVPEMLYEIRQAKFVIAELTGHNNGAYFEAGYALGNRKEVIQLCKEDTFGKDGHFDVKQVNTILWKDEEDLTLRLVNRIKATIA